MRIIIAARIDGGTTDCAVVRLELLMAAPAVEHKDQRTESPFGGQLNAFIDSICP